MRLRRSRCASDPSSDSARTATLITWRGPAAASDPILNWCWLQQQPDMRRAAPSYYALGENDTHAIGDFPPPCPRTIDVSCCNGSRLDGRTMSPLEHVLVRSMAFSPRLGGPDDGSVQVRRPPRSATSSLPCAGWCAAGPPRRARSRRPAASSRATPMRGVRRTTGWRELGIFGVAIPEELGGAGGSVEDLCVMVDEAAAALVPGPGRDDGPGHAGVTDRDVLDALAAGQTHRGRRPGRRHRIRRRRTASGTRRLRAGRARRRLLLLPAGRPAGFCVDATGRRRDGRAAWRPPTSPVRWRASSCRRACHRSRPALPAGRRPHRDGARGRGCRAGPLDAGDRDRVREGA